MNSTSNVRAVLTFSMLGLAACGDDPNGLEGGTADLSATLATIPAWEELGRPVTPSADPLVGDVTSAPARLPDSDPRYSGDHLCQTTPYSLAKNPEKIVTGAALDAIVVPGVLIQGNSHLALPLQELRITQRTPIDLVINEAGTLVPARTIESPSLGALQTGVNSLIQDAETSGFDYSSNVLFEQVTSFSSEQAALALDVSARYLGASARAQLRTETSGSTTTVTARFIQSAFTIRANGPDFAEDWFTDEFTQAELDRYLESGRIGPDSPPLYVLEVTYGRIVMVTMTANESREEVEGIFEAGYRNSAGLSLDGKLTARQEQILRDSELQIVSVGGPAEGGFEFAREILGASDPDAVGLDGFFAQDVALTTFVPISYKIADLRTGRIAVVGETTEYEGLECARRAESDFESGEDGWTGVYARPGDPDHRTGSNARSGNGYLEVTEDNSLVTYLQAPGKFTGNKELYYGGELQYWAQVDCGVVAGGPGPGGQDPDCLTNSHGWVDSDDAGDLLIESNTSTKVLVGRLAQDVLPKYDWVPRFIPLEEGPFMYVYDQARGQTESTAVRASEADIREVLSDISRVRIRAEFMAGAIDWIFVDDVRMLPPDTP